MKIFATFVIFLVIATGYSLAVQKNSKRTVETPPVPKNVTTNSNRAEQGELLVPGITISKGFKKTSCLVSRFAVLCASTSTADGCIASIVSKTKCGRQCVCGRKECACGTSGCYCQVDGGCKCDGSK